MPKIAGYKPDKSIVVCDVDESSIQQNNIDPWHLDLFDEAPVSLSFNGEKVFFSPRRRCAVVHVDGFKTYVLIQDRQRKIVATGHPVHGQNFQLKAFKVVDESFDKLLVKQLASTEGRVLSSENMRLVGDTLSFDYDDKHLLRGSMFSKTKVEKDTGAACKRLLEMLNHFEPILFGDGLSGIMVNSSHRQLHVAVQMEDVGKVMALLADNEVQTTAVNHNGLLPARAFYRRVSTNHLAAKFSIEGQEFWLHSAVAEPSSSSELVTCTEPNVLNVALIALHDIRNKKRRAVKGSLTDLTARWDSTLPNYLNELLFGIDKEIERTAQFLHDLSTGRGSFIRKPQAETKCDDGFFFLHPTAMPRKDAR